MKKIIIGIFILAMLLITGCDENIRWNKELKVDEANNLFINALIVMEAIIEGDYERVENIIYWDETIDKTEKEKRESFDFMSQMVLFKLVDNNGVKIGSKYNELYDLEVFYAEADRSLIDIRIKNFRFSEKLSHSKVDYVIGKEKTEIKDITFIREDYVWKLHYHRSLMPFID